MTGSSSARDIATCLVCHHIEETFRICSVLAYNVAETFNEYFSTTAEKLQNKIITNAQFFKKSPVMEQSQPSLFYMVVENMQYNQYTLKSVSHKMAAAS